MGKYLQSTHTQTEDWSQKYKDLRTLDIKIPNNPNKNGVQN